MSVTVAARLKGEMYNNINFLIMPYLWAVKYSHNAGWYLIYTIQHHGSYWSRRSKDSGFLFYF